MGLDRAMGSLPQLRTALPKDPAYDLGSQCNSCSDVSADKQVFVLALLDESTGTALRAATTSDLLQLQLGPSTPVNAPDAPVQEKQMSLQEILAARAEAGGASCCHCGVTGTRARGSWPLAVTSTAVLGSICARRAMLWVEDCTVSRIERVFCGWPGAGSPACAPPAIPRRQNHRAPECPDLPRGPRHRVRAGEAGHCAGMHLGYPRRCDGVSGRVRIVRYGQGGAYPECVA